MSKQNPPHVPDFSYISSYKYTMPMTNIILASSSPYRKDLLARLISNFDCISPEIDESPKVGELPEHLCLRLAKEKAQRVSMIHRSSWIIGSDQTVSFEEKCIGKPGSIDKAILQLKLFSGKEVEFYTSVCLYRHQGGDLRSDGGKDGKNSRDRAEESLEKSETIVTKVKFRKLTAEEISNYIKKDKPLDCAGSFKCESLGISLFESIESTDPTALIGLPLIATANLLRWAGIDPLA